MRRVPYAEALAGLLTATVLFVVAPSNVVLRNLQDLPAGPQAGALAAMFAAAFAVAGAAGVWLLTRGRPGLARMALLPGIVVLGIDIAAAWSQQPDISSAAAVAIDVLAVGAALGIVGLTPLPLLISVLAVVVPVTLAQSAFEHARVLSGPAGNEAAVSGAPASRAAIAGKGNVYHIILDAFQREVFEKLRDDDATAAPAGFQYFPRFTAGYAFTMYSLPHLLTGNAYRETQTFDEWQKLARTGGLWRALAEAGVALSLYPHWRTYCSPLASDCFSNQQAMRELAGSSTERMIVDLWFLRLLPGSVRKRMIERVEQREVAAAGEGALAHGTAVEAEPTPAREHTWGAKGDHHPLTKAFSVTSFVAGLTAGSGAAPAPPHTFAETEKLASLANVERFLAEEEGRAATGRYVFVHVHVPHLPFVLDAGCEMKDASRRVGGARGDGTLVPAILEQSACALRLVRRIVDGLARMGRLERALTIVHSDHAHDHHHTERLLARFPQYFTNEWEGGDHLAAWRSSLSVALRSHALLLVRRPGENATGDRTVQAEMSDIAPTVLRHFDLSTDGFEGRALFDEAAAVPRQVVFHAGEPTPEFFRGGTARNVVLPAGGHFSRFVLENGVWRHRGDEPVH